MPGPKRPMPEGFAEYLKSHSQSDTIKHFRIGYTAGARFAKECGLSELMESRMKMKPLSMPEDFPSKAQLSNDELSEIYGVRSRAVFARWRKEAGQPKRRVVEKMAAPDTFREAARGLTRPQLCKRYGVSKGVIARWLREADMEAYSPKLRPLQSWGLTPPAKVQDCRPDSLVTRAQTHLQRIGPVFKRGDGFYVFGRQMTVDAMLSRAEALGFDPNEWKRVADADRV